MLSGLLLGLAAAPGAAAAVPAGLPQAGVSIAPIQPASSLDDVARQLDVAKRSGASYARTEMQWRHVEPEAAGRRDEAFLALADQAFALATQRGLRIVLTVVGTPCYLSTAPAATRGDCSTAQQREQAASWQPSDPAALAPVAAALAARYRSQLAGIELWNEPDHENRAYFEGPDKAANYARLTRAAYPAVKAAAPGVPVLAGALVGSDGGFLRALYAAGFKGSYDVLSVHYYDLVLTRLRLIRQAQAAAGDTAPLWLNEFGWTSCLAGATTFQRGHQCVTSAVQARNTRDVLRALRGATYVRGATLYQALDNAEYDFGLVDRAGRDKPVLAAMRSALTRRGTPSPVRLVLRRRGGRLVASGSAPVGDQLQLEVRQGRTLRYRATFTLDRHNRYALELPAVLGTRGLQVRVRQQWRGSAATKRT